MKNNKLTTENEMKKRIDNLLVKEEQHQEPEGAVYKSKLIYSDENILVIMQNRKLSFEEFADYCREINVSFRDLNYSDYQAYKFLVFDRDSMLIDNPNFPKVNNLKAIQNLLDAKHKEFEYATPNNMLEYFRISQEKRNDRKRTFMGEVETTHALSGPYTIFESVLNNSIIDTIGHVYTRSNLIKHIVLKDKAVTDEQENVFICNEKTTEFQTVYKNIPEYIGRGYRMLDEKQPDYYMVDIFNKEM